MEPLYQGSKDIFLAKIRADFDKVEDQNLKSSKALMSYSLVGTDSMGDSLFTKINQSSGVVWRHVGVMGAKALGTRNAGGNYPTSEFIRGYETAISDPDNQIAGQFVVPEERDMKEGSQYKTVLNRAGKLLAEIDRTNVKDVFEVFNIAFTAPSTYPSSGVGKDRFFARGNMGLDGANTALGERLISISHARADGGTTWSNALQSSGNARVFSDDAFWAAREQGAAMVDDLGKPFPAFGGSITLVVPPANGLVRLAKQLNETELITNSAENDINIHKGSFLKIISSPYMLASAYVSGVANTNAWFLIDSSNRDPELGTGLICLTYLDLNTRAEKDQNTDSYIYKVKQEKLYGFMEPRAILGSKGTNAAYSS